MADLIGLKIFESELEFTTTTNVSTRDGIIPKGTIGMIDEYSTCETNGEEATPYRLAFYIDNATFTDWFTEEQVINITDIGGYLAEGWTIKQIKKGYDVFIADGSDYLIPDAKHIEKIDAIDKFEDDTEASKQAEKDGIKLIYGMEGIDDGVYVDTLKNRDIINKYLKGL